MNTYPFSALMPTFKSSSQFAFLSFHVASFYRQSGNEFVIKYVIEKELASELASISKRNPMSESSSIS